MLLDGVADVAEVMNVAQRLLEVLQLPVEIDEFSVTVPASIGIAIAEQGHAHSNLMRDADIALYRAKEQGKNRIAVFDASMGWEAYSRLRLRTQLESAIENEELRVLFQPIISLGSREIVGVEALSVGSTRSSARSRRRSSSRSPRRARSSPSSGVGCCSRRARTRPHGTAAIAACT